MYQSHLVDLEQPGVPEMIFQTFPERTMRSYSRPSYATHIVWCINARNLLGKVNTGMT